MIDTKHSPTAGAERVVQRVQLVAPLPKRKRVAAYARVSLDKDTMLHSLAAQVGYYNEYIQKHPEWEFAGVYADEGISGTKANRPEFQRLLDDCRAGKIDLILVKSISRFARNTLTMLATVRELKALGIDVLFEKEGIHSMSGDGELMLSILASFAQAESQSVSENCRWRIQKNFKEGIPVGAFMYGYKMKNGHFNIIPEEAAVVRRIYQMYLEGRGRGSIAKILNKEHIPAPEGGLWNSTGIYVILRNEKYSGDLLLQKYYVKDYLTKKKMKNQGEFPQYYIEDDHEAIIDKDTFERVQVIINDRANKYAGTLKEPADSQNKYPRREDGNYLFTKKIICGVCGHPFGRKIAAPGSKYEKAIWICNTYAVRGKDHCASKRVSEALLVQIVCEILDVKEEELPVAIQRVDKIVVFPDGKLIVEHDGKSSSAKWANPSRRDSWDEESKKLARERSIAAWKRKCGE